MISCSYTPSAPSPAVDFDPEDDPALPPSHEGSSKRVPAWLYQTIHDSGLKQLSSIVQYRGLPKLLGDNFMTVPCSWTMHWWLLLYMVLQSPLLWTRFFHTRHGVKPCRLRWLPSNGMALGSWCLGQSNTKSLLMAFLISTRQGWPPRAMHNTQGLISTRLLLPRPG